MICEIIQQKSLTETKEGNSTESNGNRKISENTLTTELKNFSV